MLLLTQTNVTVGLGCRYNRGMLVQVRDTVGVKPKDVPFFKVFPFPVTLRVDTASLHCLIFE